MRSRTKIKPLHHTSTALNRNREAFSVFTGKINITEVCPVNHPDAVRGYQKFYGHICCRCHLAMWPGGYKIDKTGVLCVHQERSEVMWTLCVGYVPITD